MEAIWQDIRFGVRTLLRSSVFSAAAIVCVALGIAANTTVFAFLNGIVLEALPFPDARRLVQIGSQDVDRGYRSSSVSWPDLQDWRAQNHTFQGMAAFRNTWLSLTGEGEPIGVEGSRVSADLLDVLQVTPEMGRGFLPEEDRTGSPGVVLLGHNLWRDRFGRDPGILDRTIHLGGDEHTVIGVMPRGFLFPENAEFWVPLKAEATPERDRRLYRVVGRMREGVTLSTARDDLIAISARLEEAYPGTNAGIRPSLEDLHDYLVGDASTPTNIFYAVVCFVLLIACANVANLMIARSTSREKDLAVRASLGAGRLRIARQLVTESMLLAVVGGGIGIWLGRYGRDLLVALIPVQMPFYIRFAITPRVILAMVGVTLLTGLLFGLAPAVHAFRFDISGTLREGSGRGSATSGRFRLRQLLVGMEVALALMLLVGAGLTMKGFVNLKRIPPGFDARGLLTYRVSLPGDVYRLPEQRIQFFEGVAEAAERIPSVTSVGATSGLPMQGGMSMTSFYVVGRAEDEGNATQAAGYHAVLPGYFPTLRIPVLEGRGLLDTDGVGSAPVVVLSSGLARRLWPESTAVGHQLRLEQMDRTVTVVGVVGDIHDRGVQRPPNPLMYLPLPQMPDTYTLSFQLRVEGAAPAALAPDARATVWDQDADIPIMDMLTMERVMLMFDWEPRLYTWLFSIFSGIALVLSAVGVYGVVAYSVGQRTREFGIRMAMGGDRRHILRLVMGQGMRISLAGALLGLIAAAGLMRFVASILYGVDPWDLSVYAATALVMIGVALYAAWIPARRATRIHPVEALRVE